MSGEVCTRLNSEVCFNSIGKSKFHLDLGLIQAIFHKHYFENPSPIPLNIPFKRGETLEDGVSGSKAVLFGFKLGIIKYIPTPNTSTIMKIIAVRISTLFSD